MENVKRNKQVNSGFVQFVSVLFCFFSFLFGAAIEMQQIHSYFSFYFFLFVF